MVGNALSHYRIVDELGRGGMGIVYLAEDKKLDRQVAIKVLPASALASEDDRARFYREAKAAAALNHPNIAQIYQIDEAVPEGSSDEEPRPFISMEYIDGETLEERIKRGPLKLKEAVRIATQIAGALGEAHEKGIVHRDVKASNVMLTSKGDAKVLDFGLALTAASTKLTRMGSTLGTVAYMSPEQARGEEVDHRTDLWALGVVLYEMVAGHNPFSGDYEHAVVYSILNVDPEPLTAVRTGVPMGLEWIISKLLAKSADHRYQSVADLIVDLSTVDLNVAGQSRMTMTGSVVSSSGALRQRGARTISIWTLIGVMLVTAVLSALAVRQYFRPDSVGERPFVIPPLAIDDVEEIRYPALSADGTSLYFLGFDTLRTARYYHYDFQESRLTPITGQVSGRWTYPRESPDGRHLVLTYDGSIHLKTLPDGAWSELYSDGLYPLWLSDTEVLFVDNVQNGVHIMDIEMDTIRSVIAPDSTDANQFVRFVYDILPEQNAALVGWEYQGTANRPADLYWLDLSSGDETHLWTGAINAYMIGDSHIWYQNGDNDSPVFVQSFDMRERRLVGERTQVLPPIDWYYLSVSRSGDILVADQQSCNPTERIRVNSNEVRGQGVRLLNDGCYYEGDISSDGSMYAGVRTESPSALQSRLEIHDWGKGRMHIIDDHDRPLRYPAFAHDGVHVFAESYESDNMYSIYRARLDGAGAPVRLIENGDAPDVSFDGSRMVFRRRNGTNSEIWTHDLESGRENMVVQQVNRLSWLAISPNGSWILYSTEGGLEMRITDVESGTTTTVPPGYSRAVFGHDSSSLYTLDDDELLRLDFRLDNGAITVDGWEPINGIDAADWRGFDIDEDGEIYYAVSLDARESKGYARLSWWQNYHTRLQGFIPSRGR